jgi:branched-subunit amino acid aminotransferase/4-amino-4-deoxychorismate lyase
MQEPICFFNGDFLPKSKVHLSVDDLGFSRGYAVFEHCRTYQRRIFHLKEHLIRLYEGGKALHLPIPYTEKQWSSICDELIFLNSYEELGIKIYVTLGLASSGYFPSSGPTVLCNPYPIKATTFKDPLSSLKIKTTSLSRSFPFCKTTFYVPGILARSMHQNCDEILFLSEDHHVLESTISSFLSFKDSTLIVPQGKLLKSITQEVLVEAAKKDFKIERRPIAYCELGSLTGPFLASSSREIAPISSIDDFSYANKPCDEILHLRELLQDYIQKQNWPLLEAFRQESFV